MNEDNENDVHIEENYYTFLNIPKNVRYIKPMQPSHLKKTPHS